KLPGKKQIQVWLKNEHSSDDVFDLLKLGTVGDSILTSPNFKIWRKFITQRINGDPDETMILKLRDQYDEEALAKLLLAAKTKGSTNNMATNLQNEQFKQWYSDGYWPGDVVKSIFKRHGEPTVSEVNTKIRREYQTYMNKFYPDWFNHDQKILITARS
ncbi:Avirulence (Avh) protein, partial [Phytophthora megakarya]